MSQAPPPPLPEPARPASVFADYPPSGAAYDELLDGSGNVRAHWQPFVEGWNATGREELEQRSVGTRRLLRENGITYTADDDPAAARPWAVDIFPLVISPQEWQQIADGVAQRARLLDLVIRDIYGDGRLLASHTLPPELVFAHPGFLRPCRGIRTPHDTFLHLYAADLVRMTDGRWHVVADRTDAPLGLGYALENRLVLTRLFPKLFRDCHVNRLAPFFLSLQQSLRELAPQRRENPRIVLLGEGPESFHYFEDAYLARYLNYTLVEAGDLAVRNERVCLKTLSGLLPVDVVFRRLADRNCDPLEFSGDTNFGVPGLLQAIRAGTVAVVNALGSSSVETPALLNCLPSLCRAVLGEELRLPSVETWWSGKAEIRQGILGMAEDLVVSQAFPSGSLLPGEPVPARPDRVSELLRDNAFSLVAHAPFLRSVVPVWDNGAAQAAPIALRVFAAWTPSGYQLMSGGLVRVVKDTRILDPTLWVGETSKDAWVVAEREVPQISLLEPAGRSAELRRGTAELPSRVADNMFWLGRYVERSDAAARVLRTLMSRLIHETDAGLAPELTPLLKTLIDEGHLQINVPVEELQRQADRLESVLAESMFDRQQKIGFLATLKALDRSINLVRDRLSLDGWRVLGRLLREFQQATGMSRPTLTDLFGLLGRVIVDLAAFGGIAAESMTRSQTWRFMEFGRRLERALHMITLIKSFLATGSFAKTSLMETLLQVCDSQMTYRSRYLAHLRPAPVLDLLLTDESNPRSLAFQLVAIEDHVAQLPHDRSQALLGLEQRLAMNMLNNIRQIDAETLGEVRGDSEQTGIDKLLVRLEKQLPRLSDLVSHKYFVHSGSPRQLAERRVDNR